MTDIYDESGFMVGTVQGHVEVGSPEQADAEANAAARVLAERELVKALNVMVVYAEQQIAEGDSYHATLPSAVAQARETLANWNALTNKIGKVE